MEENKAESGQDAYVQIIGESTRKLITLKLLANFFNHADLFAVLIRTKVIHNLFEGNKTLDINKLDLFHIQYTNTLIDLFQKLKRSKEQNYQLINDEIYINEDFITRLKLDVADQSFTDDIRVHNVNMSQKLEALYRQLETGINSHFSWNEVISFSARRSTEYYREITPEKFRQLTVHPDKKTYENANVVIERKLLGKLNIQQFKVKFLCGLRCGDENAEVFDFMHSSEKLVFVNDKKALYLLDSLQVEGINLNKNLSGKNQVLEQLQQKNEALKEQLTKVRSSLPADVEDVLESYLAKISGVDFLEELQNVDEQTNILKAMLNINIK